MNLQTMLFIARSQIRDLGVKKISDPELIAFVNNGKCDLVSMIREAREDYFIATTTSTVTATTSPNPSIVTLPTNFLELKELKITTSGYEYIDFVASDRSRQQFRSALLDGGSFGSGTGIVLYDVYGNSTLMLAPGFDVTLSLQIDYIYDVPDMALPADEPTDIPDNLHFYIPTAATCQALRALGDPRLANFEKQRKDSMDEARISIQPRQIREAKFVRGYMEDEEW
jgi:hypothetical protein